LIFSGEDTEGNEIIFDYMIGTFDPSVKTEQSYEYTYTTPTVNIS